MNKKHQDYIYMNENYYDNPKEMFTFLKNMIVKHFQKPSVLDIGCARGEFLYYLKNNINYECLHGIDYSEQLINAAKSFAGLNGVAFEVACAEHFSINKKFDVITMIGVLPHFDETKLFIKNWKKHLKENGKIIFYDLFNDYDVDVRIRYRNNKYSNEFQTGWNFHSIHSIKKEIEANNLYIDEQKVFNLSFRLGGGGSDDPCRAWHIDTEKGRKFTNGLGLIYEYKALVIKKQK